MKFEHKLMFNNFRKEDFKPVISLLKKKNPILTQSKSVEKFEINWSKWLGVKHSVFVNSGASANFLSMFILKEIAGPGEVIVPTLTWVSDISSVLLNGFKPVFVDVNPYNLGMNDNQILKKINKKTKAVFITHVLGFNSFSQKLINELKRRKIKIIEDVCESHGATFNNKKLGTFGLISNFSFYYAHHMSTIEGGMISTNNTKIYEMARMMRSHGMLREIKNNKLKNIYKKKYKVLNSDFIFMMPGFNMRNNEIGALIGINQLKRLDSNNQKRRKNYKLFLEKIDKTKFRTNFDTKGSCNYAFTLIMKNKNFSNRRKLENTMKNNNIEFRKGMAGGGNQLLQPYIKKYINKFKKNDFKEINHIHQFGYYIGNYPDLKKTKIEKICKILNSSF